MSDALRLRIIEVNLNLFLTGTGCAIVPIRIIFVVFFQNLKVFSRIFQVKIKAWHLATELTLFPVDVHHKDRKSYYGINNRL